MDLDRINEELSDKSPREIIQWALSVAKRPILTTNFRPLASTIIHAVVSEAPQIHVIWIDSGYNTVQTYRYANRTILSLNLNIDIYVPKQSVGYRNVTMGIPEVDTPEHDEFTRQVKLEPFERALANSQPDVWFANLRKEQTELRNHMNIVNLTKDGVLKVCPFFHWTEAQLEDYLLLHDLDSEENYYDPTKAFETRECGLHT